jgi:steroid 5-alpha reductase family enzyme
MMWNFWIMFFYTACLEITISLVLGYQYLQEYDKHSESPQYLTINTRNKSTRNVHKILLYVFFVLQAIAFLTVSIIMTRKTKTMDEISPKFGALYKTLKYD